VVSKIRDAEYGLVAHGSLAVAAPTATTRLSSDCRRDYGVTCLRQTTPKIFAKEACYKMRLTQPPLQRTAHAS
jgi:hypothetical protein